jgi:hypothetical protein
MRVTKLQLVGYIVEHHWGTEDEPGRLHSELIEDYDTACENFKFYKRAGGVVSLRTHYVTELVEEVCDDS